MAVKLLRPDAMNEEDIRRLTQEVEILARLQHPCIVRLYGSGVADGGSPYVLMELVEGIDLRQQLLRRRALPLEEVIDLVAQLCSALREAHQAGVVHRDVKPENVLLRAPGHRAAKLVDFGTAKRLDPGAPVLTFDDKILGTPYYLAPERALGQPASGAADVYAVAIMTYEMLAGRLPFDGQSPLQIVTRHLREPPPLLPGAPRAVERVVHQGLSKDPLQRPAPERYAELLASAALSPR